MNSVTRVVLALASVSILAACGSNADESTATVANETSAGAPSVGAGVAAACPGAAVPPWISSRVWAMPGWWGSRV